jgi:hypothetical protein
VFEFGSNNDPINFDKDIEPLIAAIDITFKLEVERKLEILSSKYKENFLKADSSRIEYKEILKKYSEKIYDDMLSDDYKKILSKKYLTEEGISTLIFYTLLTKAEETTTG